MLASISFAASINSSYGTKSFSVAVLLLKSPPLLLLDEVIIGHNQ